MDRLLVGVRHRSPVARFRVREIEMTTGREEHSGRHRRVSAASTSRPAQEATILLNVARGGTHKLKPKAMRFVLRTNAPAPGAECSDHTNYARESRASTARFWEYCARVFQPPEFNAPDRLDEPCGHLEPLAQRGDVARTTAPSHGDVIVVRQTSWPDTVRFRARVRQTAKDAGKQSISIPGPSQRARFRLILLSRMLGIVAGSKTRMATSAGRIGKGDKKDTNEHNTKKTGGSAETLPPVEELTID